MTTRRVRIGFTVTKKIGNAVVRNRMKRRFRALARELAAEPRHCRADHVLIGRSGGIERDYATLRDELTRALAKAAAMIDSMLIAVTRGWQKGPSRVLPPSCRFQPSCSAYAITALKRYGAAKGSWLAIKRIARCHPWGGMGHDPVP